MNTLRLVMAAGLFLAGAAAADHRQIEVPVGHHGSLGTLHLYVFDAREVALKIIDQGGIEVQRHKDLGAAMEAHNCPAGTNGGFFDHQGKPLGLAVADGKQFGAPNHKSILTEGVLFQDGARLRILRAPSFFGNGAIQAHQLLQAGPFLVENGKPVERLGKDRHERRTFIVTDGGHQWALGYSPPTTLAVLGEILSDENHFTPFKVHTALNLGGGSSSGIWVKTKHSPFYLQEIDPVRNFIGLVRR